MASESNLLDAWNHLAPGARMAFGQQWVGLAAGGLPCGASILDEQEQIVALGRNHVYDQPEKASISTTSPLQYTRVAHAEINALASVPSNREPQLLTLWTTQHPCIMCAAAIRFIGIGKVCYIADDPSDGSPARDIIASRGSIPYETSGDRLWWTVSNLLFLYNSAVKHGADAGNLRKNRDRYPALVQLTLQMAKDDPLGKSARAGIELPQALLPYYPAILQAASNLDRRWQEESCMQEVTIRPVALSDAQALAPLIGQLGYPTTPSEMEQRLKNILPQSNYHALVAICDGQVAGMIGLFVGWGYHANGLRGEIISLVVAQEHRSRGVGARLVAEGERWLQEHGANRITVNSGNWRPDAHRFYERLGYQATGVRFVKTMPQ